MLCIVFVIEAVNLLMMFILEIHCIILCSLLTFWFQLERGQLVGKPCSMEFGIEYHLLKRGKQATVARVLFAGLPHELL